MMTARSAIRQDLAARIAAIDVTPYKQDANDGWRHARVVDLTQPGTAWAHLSYAVMIGNSRFDERQRRADEHTITEAAVVFWYSVREMTAAGGFDDVDLILDLQEAVCTAIAIDDTSPAYAVRIDGVGQPIPASTGPVATMICQIDITIHHSLALG